MSRRNMWRAIGVGGVLCGVLDISAAIARSATRGVAPSRVLQAVAAGLLGRSSYDGGIATAALGLLLHFFIAYSVTAIYYGASRKMPVLIRHAVLSGLLYGIAVFFVMNRIVVPLSNFPGGGGAFNLQASLPQIVIHMLCVGLPIALAIRHYESLRFIDPSSAYPHRRSDPA